MTQYWHMQMHPDDQNFSSENLHLILENKNYWSRKVGGWTT